MAYPPVFTDVLATRIAEYTGRDRAGVLAVVRTAGDRLPDRLVDLMFENARAHLGGETQAERADAEREAERNREESELFRGLGFDDATETATLATRHGQLPPRPVAREMTDVAAEAPAHADWAEFELDLETLVGRLDPETGSGVRAYVTGSGPIPPSTLRDDLETTDRRLRDRLRQDLLAVGNSAADGPGPGLVAVQQARADAEQVFSRAVGAVQPMATALGEPRAVAADRSARIESALTSLSGLPADRLGRETVGGWLADAEQRAELIRSDPQSRDENVSAFTATVDRDLQRAAGDVDRETNRRLRFGSVDVDPTFRDGTAVAWTSQARPEILGRLGLPDELADATTGAAPDRFEGQVVAAFADSLAEHTGRSQAEILDVLRAADPDRDTTQFIAARRLLVPDDQLARLGPDNAHRAGLEIAWAMHDEFRRAFQDREDRREPGRSAESIGSAVAAAAVRTRDGWGLGPASGERAAVGRDADPALQATVGIGLPPEAGRDAAAGTAGTASAAGSAADGRSKGTERRAGPARRTDPRGHG
jgi:hypothetical protein